MSATTQSAELGVESCEHARRGTRGRSADDTTHSEDPAQAVARGSTAKGATQGAVEASHRFACSLVGASVLRSNDTLAECCAFGRERLSGRFSQAEAGTILVLKIRIQGLQLSGLTVIIIGQDEATTTSDASTATLLYPATGQNSASTDMSRAGEKYHLGGPGAGRRAGMQ